jgi:hypothetical protein
MAVVEILVRLSSYILNNVTDALNELIFDGRDPRIIVELQYSTRAEKILQLKCHQLS